MYEYRAQVVKIVDGDTIDVELDLGFNVHLKERLRFYGVNTPETKGKTRAAGLAAKEFVAEKLASGRAIVRTLKDKKGKFGRYLAVVFPASDDWQKSDRALNEQLIENGHAVEFMKK